MYIDRVHFYVENASKWRDWFVKVVGFQAIASGQTLQAHTEVVSSGDNNGIKFVFSSPLTESSPVAQYLRQHPPGVADVAFLVRDIQAVMERVKVGGAKVLQPLQRQQFARGDLQWSKINNNVSFSHTLIQRTGKTPLLPELPSEQQPWLNRSEVLFNAIDHIVLNVEAGYLQPTVNWYEGVLGFQRKQTFAIETQHSGLYSQVMVHPVSGVQFPINEPISVNSQVQEFLDINRGAGIQHLALKTTNITRVTKQLRAAGMSFLSVPDSYYEQLAKECSDRQLSVQEWQEIVQQRILVDSCQETTSSLSPLLLQIFTQPIFKEPTFFLEIIERRDRACGFGEGNFRALFAAIEQEQSKRGSLGHSNGKTKKEKELTES
ncbi:4-hydroxyphenylpyruvate dioxygenase [Pleurocapsales cyanobacterium LEGE 06147]|nr:4-hydroxyphenylpyruvate dioxygenase [Pleurocapsales cyanobacterium LEGE 06147]